MKLSNDELDMYFKSLEDDNQNNIGVGGNKSPMSTRSKKTRISYEEISEEILSLINNGGFDFIPDSMDIVPNFDYPPFVADYFVIHKRLPHDILTARFLDVNTANPNLEVRIKLYSPWNELEFREEHLIYLNAKYNSQLGFYEVQSDTYVDKELEKKGKILYSYLVIHPQMLLSPTAIKMSYPCARKAYFDLEYYLLYRITLTMEIVVGLVAHNVLEDLFNDQVGKKDIEKKIEISTIISKVQFYKRQRLFDLSLIQNYDVDEIERNFDDLAGKIYHFWTTTFKNYNCVVDGGVITSIICAERRLFNTELGIKGCIDFEMNYSRNRIHEMHIPGEIKSGAAKREDERQLSLYCMLLTKEEEEKNSNYSEGRMEMKDFEDIKFGFLVYLRSGKTELREFKRHFCVHLLKSRNEVAILLRVSIYI
jgi:hypothetical protein